MPIGTIAPENRTHTGVGATAWASASQKWKGAIAPFTRKAVSTSTKAAMINWSGAWWARSRPSWGSPRLPVRAKSSPIPINDR